MDRSDDVCVLNSFQDHLARLVSKEASVGEDREQALNAKFPDSKPT